MNRKIITMLVLGIAEAFELRIWGALTLGYLCLVILDIGKGLLLQP